MAKVATHIVILFLALDVQSQSYQETVTLLEDKLNPESYRPEVRPQRNQSSIMEVVVQFALLSIVGIDDLAQTFTCNGYFVFGWMDEIIAWDPNKYNGEQTIHPYPGSVWRPRVILMNTLDKRDVFADDMAPFLVKSSGLVMWAPGSLFTVSCELVMDNYPFDEHNCSIVMKSMTYTYNQLRFTNLQKPVITKYFSNTTEWDLKAIQFDIPTNLRADTNAEFSISMSLRRRPYFLLFNVVLPVVFLSFLNILVFAIPGNSGEKISYGITVLLALSVFLSTVGGMLPRTGTVPKLTTYLFTLLIISTLTVVDSIIIVFIHHMEEKEQQHQKAKSNFLRALDRFTAVRRVVSPGITSPKKQDLSEKTQEGGHTDTPDSKKPNSDDSNGHLKGHSKNGYKVIGNHMDLVSFIVFLVIWLAVTINFVVNIATK